jgi:uncharacterized protein (TIGR02466 family)|tara:strand:+ start:177 stop:773 length:597 start_codon:yes stop_codon:yes gene_type:complete
MIYNLFPTAVGHYNIDRKLTKTEKKFLVELEKKENEGNKTSSDHYVLGSPKLSKLKGFLEDSLKEYIDQTINPVESNELYVTQSWVNYTKEGEYHHKHTHSNSIVSGVFYVDTVPDRDRINFFKDGYSTIKPETKDWNSYNSESWWYETKPGDLYLFPSSLPHSVFTVPKGKTRISLSFNTFIKGSVGVDSELTELKL